jgi:hypothetical protein
MSSAALLLSGPAVNVQSLRHPSAGRYVRQAIARGFRIAHQAAWPNSAGWIALSRPESMDVDVLVRYYRDQSFTVQVCDPNRTLDELLPDDESTIAID